MADSEWCGAVNAIAPDMQRIHQSCIKIWLQEKLTYIRITGSEIRSRPVTRDEIGRAHV